MQLLIYQMKLKLAQNFSLMSTLLLSNFQIRFFFFAILALDLTANLKVIEVSQVKYSNLIINSNRALFKRLQPIFKFILVIFISKNTFQWTVYCQEMLKAKQTAPTSPYNHISPPVITSPLSQKLQGAASPNYTSQQKFFKRTDRTQNISQFHSARTLKSSQSIGNFNFHHNQIGSPRRKDNEILEKEKEIDALKAQIRVLSAKLHQTRIQRLNSEQLSQENTSETIKSLNLTIAKKVHCIGKIQKIVKQFQAQINEKGIKISAQCLCKMQQIVEVIGRKDKNVLVRENAQQKIADINGNKIVVVYREEGCQEDWRVWRSKWQQSQIRIVQLNYEIERLYQHQNQLLVQRTSFIQHKAAMETKFKNLTHELNGWNSANLSNDQKIKKLEIQKAHIFGHKQELLKQNSTLKTSLMQFQIRQNNYKSQLKSLSQQLQDYKKNVKILSQWKSQKQEKQSIKSEYLHKMLWETEYKLNNMSKDRAIANSLGQEVQRANCKIMDLQVMNKHLEQEKADIARKIQAESAQFQIKFMENNRQKLLLSEKIKSLEFKTRTLQGELEIQKKVHRDQSHFSNGSSHENSYQVQLLRRNIYNHQLEINRLKNLNYQYEVQEETLKAQKQKIKRLEERIFQHSFELQTLDMLKPKVAQYQKTITELKSQISRLQSLDRREQSFHISSRAEERGSVKKDVNMAKLDLQSQMQNTTTFESQFFKQSHIINFEQKDRNYIESLQNKCYQYESQLTQLKNENSAYRNRVYEAQKNINNYSCSQVIQNHTEIHQIMTRNKQTIITLERKVNLYVDQLEILNQKVRRYERQIREFEKSGNSQKKSDIGSIFEGLLNVDPENPEKLQNEQADPEQNKLILQFTKNLFLHTQNEQIIKDLKMQNQRCKIDLEEAKRNLDQIKFLNENPNQRDHVINDLNSGFKTLQQDIAKLNQQLSDKEFTISQLGNAIQILQEKEDVKSIVKNHALFKQAVNQIRKLNEQLNVLYAEKDNLLIMINKKGAVEIDLKKAHSRIKQIEDEKQQIVRDFEELRSRLLTEIKQKDELISKLQGLLERGDHSHKEDEYFRYKADPRYLQLKKKIFELQKSYSTHNQVTHEFFHQYRKEHLQSHQKVLDLIRQTFATLKKFEQTVVIKKSTLKRFNLERLRQLQTRIVELKNDNLQLRADFDLKLVEDFEKIRKNVGAIMDINA